MGIVSQISILYRFISVVTIYLFKSYNENTHFFVESNGSTNGPRYRYKEQVLHNDDSRNTSFVGGVCRSEDQEGDVSDEEGHAQLGLKGL